MDARLFRDPSRDSAGCSVHHCYSRRHRCGVEAVGAVGSDNTAVGLDCDLRRLLRCDDSDRIVIRRYRLFERPFWSAFVWRLELVNAPFEFLATPIGLRALRGTPFVPWYLRLLGARLGRRVFIDSTGFLEFDLLAIGDRSILNYDSILQTHLFEDRVLKAAGLRVGADCEIGTQSIVLYGSEMVDKARLGPLSLRMKGEVLLPGKVWAGSPLSVALTIPLPILIPTY
jgi:non-ribosomal peptide synthetase-like protein